MKLDIYITRPVDFCKSGYYVPRAITAMEHGDECIPDKWIFWQTIEVDETLVDTAKVLEAATAEIDQKEREVKAEYASRMHDIEKRRGELLALPGVSR